MRFFYRISFKTYFLLEAIRESICLRAAGVSAVHAGAAHPYGDRKGEEPLAKCGRTLWCTPAGTTVLRIFFISVVDPR
jgi:hypothetical protein